MQGVPGSDSQEQEDLQPHPHAEEQALPSLRGQLDPDELHEAAYHEDAVEATQHVLLHLPVEIKSHHVV